MDRKALFEKWNKHPEHDYEIKDTLQYTDGEREQDISFVYSGRERGKSFDIVANLLADAWYDGKGFGYLRRNVETRYDIEEYFADKVDFIKDMTDGKADGVTVNEGSLYLYKDSVSEKGVSKREYIKFIGKPFAISRANKYKSHQYPDIYDMIYEEVLTTDAYLQAEPEKVLSIYSTINRPEGVKKSHLWLVSNLVSVVNPYSKAWGIYLSKNKAGDVRLTRLYLGSYDKDGKEKYLLVGAHYLKDKNELSKEDKKKNRNRVKTGIANNKWDELKLFPHLDLSFVKQYKIEDNVVFEYDDIMLQGSIILVPKNVMAVYRDGEKPMYDIPALYIRRKTTEPYETTRLYTNNPERFSDYVTRGFYKVYKIDMIVEQLIARGWIFGADNLTMNDFDNIYKKLRLMKCAY